MSRFLRELDEVTELRLSDHGFWPVCEVCLQPLGSVDTGPECRDCRDTRIDEKRAGV